MKRHISILLLLLILAFTFHSGPPKGWYQQFVALPPGSIINDMVFLDSLTGLIVTDRDTTNTSHVLKTTDGGDNWSVVHSDLRDFRNLFKLTDSIVYSCAGNMILKTTDRGDSWNGFSGPAGTGSDDIYALNEDTMWVVSATALTGGIFRSTDAGASWVRISGSPGVFNPERIYFIDAFTGFITPPPSASIMYRTTDGGFTWKNVSGATGFIEMYFINNTTGWKSRGGTDFSKTTNSGQTWESLPIPPPSGIVFNSNIIDFSVLNEDTIWGVGAWAFLGSGQNRGLIYITTDGGNTWGYQLPDSSIHIIRYYYANLTNKNNIWAYFLTTGVHTITGGDTTILLNIEQISSEVPVSFKLHQNYPNPFNPVTKINYDLKVTALVRLKIFDITGKEIAELVNQRQGAGTYQYTFNASGLSSGTYFYRLEAGDYSETKRMLLIK